MTWTTPATGPHSPCYTLYRDMLEQPHLMIAGTTGSGKSVAVNALIYTALYRLPTDAPNGAQLILIDPKRVELAAYKHLPHTLRYASEPAGMIEALRYAMQLTEARYRAMQRKGLRDYPGGDVYIIIDEFADLMTTDRKHVQPLIQRLAQIGRAAHIHIILATQCPLAKVIPTEIKVNFDSRVGLRCRSAQDSRNILGFAGCETFPNPRTERKAFGYYMTPDETTLYSIPMIPENELTARVQWWTSQNKILRLFHRSA